MPTKTPLWRGSSSLTEAPDSPDWTFGNDKDVCVRIFTGPYAKCLSEKPKVGGYMTGMPSGFGTFKVQSVGVKRAPGGKGVLTVTLQHIHATGSLLRDTKESEPEYEIEWVQVEKKLETHPLYQADGDKPLGVSDWIGLSMWEKEEDPDFKTAFQYRTSSDSSAELSANAQHFAAKKLAGTDTYLAFAPVARKVTQMRSCPDGSSCGVRTVPRFLRGPLKSKYQWLRTADRGTRSGDFGKWERTIEWTGSERIDAELYPDFSQAAGD